MAGNGRSKAGSSLSSLACPSLWSRRRRSFGIRRGGCDALLVVLKINGDVEAAGLMESIDGACCSEPTTSSPRTPIAVWPVNLAAFIVVVRSAMPEGIWRCSHVARKPVLMHRYRLSEWIAGSGSHCGLSVFEPCSASWLCGVLLLALCMPLHGFVGQEVALLA